MSIQSPNSWLMTASGPGLPWRQWWWYVGTYCCVTSNCGSQATMACWHRIRTFWASSVQLDAMGMVPVSMVSLQLVVLFERNMGMNMMASSNGILFRVTGHLCGEFTGHRWIPRTKASDAELWCFFICAWINSWVNNRGASDLRRHRALLWRHCNETGPQGCSWFENLGLFQHRHAILPIHEFSS